MSSVWGRTEKYYVIQLETLGNESIIDLYGKLLKDNKEVKKNQSAYLKTLKKNPHVIDWENIKKGSKLRIYVPATDLDSKKYSKIKKKYKIQMVTNSLEYENYKGSTLPRGLKSSLYVSYFRGELDQKNGYQSAEFDHQSFINFGGQGNYYLNQTNHSLGFGLSAAKIDKASSNFDLGDVNLPWELNGYLYGEYKLQRRKTTFHYGFDYEKFSSIDLKESDTEQEVVLEKNSLVYGSFGVSTPFSILRTSFFTKLIFSRTLISNSYEGYRTTLYLNKKFGQRYYIMSNFRYQSLSDESDMKIFRVGLGLGIMF